MSTASCSFKRDLLGVLFWVVLLAFFFANVEIQIEGPAGWAANLPTWRIEKHWALDIFWGGRPMTGYHAWIFSFMALAFHYPCWLLRVWNWRIEMRIIASLGLFWVIEDFLWFVLNPAFGLAAFNPAHIPWHKHWWWIAPADYWVSTMVAIVLLTVSCRDFAVRKRAEK